MTQPAPTSRPLYSPETHMAEVLQGVLGRIPTDVEVHEAVRLVRERRRSLATPAAAVPARRQSQQMRAATSGRPVKPLPTAGRRKVNRKVRKARKIVNGWLAAVGALMILAALVMLAASAFAVANG